MYKTLLLARWEGKRDIQWKDFCSWCDENYPLDKVLEIV